VRRLGRRLPFTYSLMLWFFLAFLATAIAFEAYAYIELKSALLGQLDATLRLEAERTAEDLDLGGANPLAPGGEEPQLAAARSGIGFSFRVVDAKGASLGERGDFPIIGTSAPVPGIATFRSGSEEYRVATSEIKGDDTESPVFLQAAHSLSATEEALEKSLSRFLVVLPLGLVACAFLSLFLARGALRPLTSLTALAESVRGNHFSGRMNYQGPMDEIGRLAKAFDSMLEGIQSSFEREKRFSADASHELRTPLAALKGNLEVALSLPRTADEYRHVLVEMSSHVDRLIRLSSDLLIYVRAGSHVPGGPRERVDLSLLLESCAGQFHDAAANKGLRMTFDIQDSITVEGLPDHLMRLFLNLFDNAVKYADEGGSVTLHAQTRERQAVVEISNSGTGLNEADLAKAFDPFFRGAQDRSRSSGGAGLGLAIAREIAGAHGGSITLSSSPGKETKVMVTLPLA